MNIAQAFGFSGTPSFVVGTQLFFGYLDRAALDKAISAARLIRAVTDRLTQDGKTVWGT